MAELYKGAIAPQDSASACLCLKVPFNQKAIPQGLGATWDPVGQCWLLDYTADVYDSIRLSVPKLHVSDDVVADLHRRADEDDIHKPLLDAPPMPIKPHIKPYAHQWGGYASALATFGVTEGRELKDNE